jgi:hypothetical protein
MRVILLTWYQIQRTSSSLRCENCGPGHIQSIYSSAYLGFNIQLNASALLLEIPRQFNARYTANLVPNTAHMLPVYAMWTVVPAIYNVFTAPHIQATIFNWTYLRCYWRYSYTSMRVILQICCQVQRTSSSLRCVNCGPGHIQCIYSSIYSDFNIHLNVSVLLLEISRQFNAPYTANLVPNTEHIFQFMLCELWSRTYTKYLQLRIFRLQFSTVGIWAAIVDITSIQCALYCKLGAKYSAYATSLRYVNCGPGHIQSIYSSS